MAECQQRLAEARQAAEEFLLSRGFEGYSLESSESLLNTCRFRFSSQIPQRTFSLAEFTEYALEKTRTHFNGV